MYTVGTVGTWMIIGEYNSLSASATVIVLRELPTNISISPILDQICHEPFNLTITIKNNQGTITYPGTLLLSDLTGSITPQVIQIVSGVWTGTVSINKSMLNDKITFETNGIKYSSNSFDVLIDNASDERIEDKGVGLEIKRESADTDYCLEIIHEPSGYEINKANYQAGTSSVLSDTLCEIKGTTASNEKLTFFQQSIALSLTYNPEDIGNMDVKTLQICKLQNGKWIPLPGTVCQNDNMVIASINETGIFILRGVTCGKSPDDVIVYPNPCKGTEIIFLHANDSTIEIYDLAGDLVKRVLACDARYSWNTCDDSGRLLDSGVYIYVIIGKKESKCGKVVIIK